MTDTFGGGEGAEKEWNNAIEVCLRFQPFHSMLLFVFSPFIEEQTNAIHNLITQFMCQEANLHSLNTLVCST